MKKSMLFSRPMVQAIRDGHKTQTRRAWKMPKGCTWYVDEPHFRGEETGDFCTEEFGGGWWSVDELGCPYGQIGDIFYVKETFFAFGCWVTRYSAQKKRDEWHFIDMTQEVGREYRYAADEPEAAPTPRARSATPDWWKRPALFMPRMTSRFAPEIIGRGVERLQEITEADALAEGIVKITDGYGLPDGRHFHGTDPRQSYFSLWEFINGAGSVAANPWVHKIEFKRDAK
jgi:hypothetical protein